MYQVDITAFIFPFFISLFSAFRRNDFEVEPVPSLQASGKLFWDARIISGAPKHNLPCSFEHEFFIRKIPSVGILITFCILKNAASRTLERCNRMTYRVTERQQATI